MARRWLPPLSVLVIIFMATVLIIADMRIKGSVLEIAQSEAQIQAIEIVNQAVNDKIVAVTDYQDIVSIHKDNQGRIIMIQANTVILNQIMANTVREVTASLKGLAGQTISIPLGQVTGSVLLAAYGPRLNVKVIPAKQVTVEVENRFEQAGINQTRHLIYFKINSRIKIAVPLVDKEIQVANTIPLADTIIVGSVPDTYLNFNTTSELAPLLK
ncbi:MAG: sporulation protein YunB [Syntrophomonas sp.]|nr:sporulation protein YunB [Syntrophomonas sp.]